MVTLGFLCQVAAADFESVALGEIRVVQKGTPDLDARFRSAVQQELSKVRLPRSNGRYVLSASLLRLWSQTSRYAATSTCAVSAVLREKRSGKLYATISGRARAQQAQSELRESERLAMHGAVKSAFSRLPRALANRD